MKDAKGGVPSADGRRIIFGSALAATMAMLPLFLAGSLVPFMRQELRFDSAQLGIAVAAFFAAGALSAVPGGRIADWLGVKTALVISSSLSAVALLVAGNSLNSIQLTIALAVGGTASGVTQPAIGLAITWGVKPGRQGIAFGFWQIAGPLAALLAGVAIPILAATVGWRWAFYSAITLLPVVALTLPSDIAPHTSANPLRQTRSGIHGLLEVVIAGGFAAAAANTLGPFLVDGIVQGGGSPKNGAALLIIGSLATIVVRLLGGWQSDLAASPNLNIVASLLAMGGAGFLVLASTPAWPLIVLGVIVSFGAGWGWPGMLVHGVIAANPRSQAWASGRIQAGLFTGAMLGPLTFGLIANEVSFAGAWGTSAAWALIAAYLLFRTNRLAS